MAIYAFDGTGNEDNPGSEEDTNVLKFFDAYKEAYNGPGKCFYVPGVGTRQGILGWIFGSLFGAGGQQRVEEAIDCLEENFAAGDTEINIIGFSRGAAMALEFANEIHEHGVNGEDSPIINFIGIWDTVASFGVPGNNVNLGYSLTVPKNAQKCFHALALDERRQAFPLTRVIQDSFSNTPPVSIEEVWFRGFHSDIGGGNSNEDLSSISLVWMLMRAIDAGIQIPDSHVSKHEALRVPEAPCSKPGMDILANRKRNIQHSDVVHESVTRREWAARRFPANNPPLGLKVTNDKGEILEQRFGE
ncbi:MAG: DUF2235 domain-containing protein [Pseudomonadota bacterium]